MPASLVGAAAEREGKKNAPGPPSGTGGSLRSLGGRAQRTGVLRGDPRPPRTAKPGDDAAHIDALTLRVPDAATADHLRANLATIVKAVEGVIGRPLVVKIGVESARAAEPPADHTGDEDPGDLMRYALKKFG